MKMVNGGILIAFIEKCETLLAHNRIYPPCAVRAVSGIERVFRSHDTL